MAELNGSEPNATNQTFFVPPVCSGSWPPKTVQITICSILTTFSLMGNLLIVFVFFRNKTLRTPVHYFIVNMAISDLIIPVIVLPDWISYVYHDGIWLVDGVLGTVLCKLVLSAWGVSIFVSILSNLVIAADRFHAVIFPMKSTLFSRSKCRLIIVVTWVASLVFRAHHLYAAKLVSYDTILFCTLQWEPASYTREVFQITWILFLFLTSLSAVLLTVLYSTVLIFLFRQKSTLHLATSVIKKRTKRNRRITYMLVITVTLFYAVWIPYNVVSFIFYLKPSIRIPCVFMWLGGWVLPLSYPIVNPVVYYIFNEDYRQGFRQLLCYPWPCFKFNGCFHSSVSPQDENNVHNAEQVNNTTTENIELQEQ